MQFLNLNFSELPTDTLNNLSDISFSADSSNYQSGGSNNIFSNIAPLYSNNNKFERAILEAAKDKNYPIVDFVIKKDLYECFVCKDKDGNTLLHYLVSNSNPSTDLVDKILHRSDSDAFINIQNNDGDTPLILAVKSGNHDICTLLEAAGADRQIKNNNGLHVGIESDHNMGNFNKSDSKEDYFKKHNMPTDGTATFVTEKIEIDEDNGNTFLNSNNDPLAFLMNLHKNVHNTNTSEPGPFNYSDDRTRYTENTDNLLDKLCEKLNVQKGDDQATTFNNLDTFLKKKNYANTNQTATTESLITAMENMINKQAGGTKAKTVKKSKSSGTRELRKHVDSDMNMSDKGARLGNVIRNQTTEIINRCVDTMKWKNLLLKIGLRKYQQKK
jgi:ankyrin repeat protein